MQGTNYNGLCAGIYLSIYLTWCGQGTNHRPARISDELLLTPLLMMIMMLLLLSLLLTGHRACMLTSRANKQDHGASTLAWKYWGAFTFLQGLPCALQSSITKWSLIYVNDEEVTSNV
jgi:hypothetical protein